MKHPQPRRAPILAALAKHQDALDKLRELLTPEYAASTRADEYARKAHNVFADRVRKNVHELLTADDYARGVVLISLSKMKRDNLSEFLDGGLLFLNNLKMAVGEAKPEIEKAFKAKGRPPGAKNGQKAIDVGNRFVYSPINF